MASPGIREQYDVETTIEQSILIYRCFNAAPLYMEAIERKSIEKSIPHDDDKKYCNQFNRNVEENSRSGKINADRSLFRVIRTAPEQ